MALDPRQLKAFLAVVKEGSLGRAAEALHITEPAVSRTIKRLEVQLQAQLFERRTTGMELTSFGQALLPHANLLHSQAEEAVAEIDSLRGLEHGLLRIGAVGSAAVMILPPVLDRLMVRWPGLHVHITEAVEDRLLVALANNTIDVAISGEISDSDDIVKISEHAFKDFHRVIASASHPFVGRSDLTLEGVLEQDWVMPSENAAPRIMFNEVLERLGAPPPKVRIETRSPAAIKAMVAATQLLGWLPEPLFAAEQAAGMVRPLSVKELDVPRRFYVHRRRQTFIAPPVSRFLEELRWFAPAV